MNNNTTHNRDGGGPSPRPMPHHLLDAETSPLVTCEIRARGSRSERPSISIAVHIEHYSAQTVATVDTKVNRIDPIHLLPTLFPERIAGLNELTRATVHVVARNLDEDRIITHETYPIWMLSRNSAQMAVLDPSTNTWRDFSRYLGAFVTPNAVEVMEFQRHVTDHHPEKKLSGYQGGESVEAQVKAVYEALRNKAEIRYVNSVIDFNPGESAKSQRIRLPRQSLSEKQANCVDGSILMASLLEGISLNPAIVVVPKHVLLAWETGERNGQWRYVETTLIDTHTFDEAVRYAERMVNVYKAQQEATGDDNWFRLLSLRDLRVNDQIWPME